MKKLVSIILLTLFTFSMASLFFATATEQSSEEEPPVASEQPGEDVPPDPTETPITITTKKLAETGPRVEIISYTTLRPSSNSAPPESNSVVFNTADPKPTPTPSYTLQVRTHTAYHTATRRAFVSFSLSGFKAGTEIKSATLHVFPYSVPNANQDLRLFTIQGAPVSFGEKAKDLISYINDNGKFSDIISYSSELDVNTGKGIRQLVTTDGTNPVTTTIQNKEKQDCTMDISYLIADKDKILRGNDSYVLMFHQNQNTNYTYLFDPDVPDNESTEDVDESAYRMYIDIEYIPPAAGEIATLEVSQAQDNYTMKLPLHGEENSNTLQMTVTPRDADGNIVVGEVDWSITGTPAGVTVDDHGLITLTSDFDGASFDVVATADNEISDSETITVEKYTQAEKPSYLEFWAILQNSEAKQTGSYTLGRNLYTKAFIYNTSATAEEYTIVQAGYLTDPNGTRLKDFISTLSEAGSKATDTNGAIIKTVTVPAYSFAEHVSYNEAPSQGDKSQIMVFINNDDNYRGKVGIYPLTVKFTAMLWKDLFDVNPICKPISTSATYNN